MRSAFNRLIVIVYGGALLFGFTGCRMRLPEAPVPPPPTLPIEVARHIPEYRPLDSRPYEFIWASRVAQQDHLLDFERLLGWRVEHSPGAVARIDRCREYQLWGEFVGLLSYSGTEPEGWVRLLPPRPISIVDPVDTLTLWMQLSDVTGSEKALGRFAALFRDAHANEYHLDTGPALDGGWRLAYRRLPKELQDINQYPLQVIAFEWSQLPAIRQAELRLDALSLFMDGLEPIRYDPRPRRPLPLEEGQWVGINRGDDTLPFPSPTATILPNPSDPDNAADLEVEQEGRGQFILSDPSQDDPIQYRVIATNGLAGFEVLWDGEATGIALKGIHLEGENPTVGEPVVTRLRQQQVYLEYPNGMIARLSVNGASLVIDVDHRGRESRGIWAGPLAVAGEYIPLEIPYLHQGSWDIPPVLFATTLDPPLFIHLMMDPYRSNASEFAMEKQGPVLYQSWRVGAQYNPRTDEIRNHLHERFVFSVGSRPLDVLPEIALPVGAQADNLVDRFVVELDVPTDSRLSDLERVQSKPEAPVLQHALVLKPDTVWRHEQESRAFRLRPNPHLGAADSLNHWFETLDSSGAMPALYLNVRELSPLNQFWSPDHLLRTADNAWRTPDGFGFIPKPIFALNWILEHGDDLHARHQPGAYWLGEFSAVPPWHHTDYDRRVPGAATFSQSLFADGDLLTTLSEQTQVPLIGAADAIQLYAGLLDGLVTTHERKTPRPYDPSFKLHRIQPLAVVFAPPFPIDLFTNESQNAESEEEIHRRLDRYLADQIAYGNAGRLPHPEANVDLEFQKRILYSQLALQRRTLLQRPERILYWNGGGYVPLATAIKEGVWHHSFIYIQYPGNLEVWVNGSEDRIWTVRADRETVDLPPSGWLATSPELFAFSGTFEGQRIDYVEAPEYLYLHPRGQPVAFRQLESVDGAPQVVRLSEAAEVNNVE